MKVNTLNLFTEKHYDQLNDESTLVNLYDEFDKKFMGKNKLIRYEFKIKKTNSNHSEKNDDDDVVVVDDDVK
jgi:hypothetical protein